MKSQLMNDMKSDPKNINWLHSPSLLKIRWHKELTYSVIMFAKLSKLWPFYIQIKTVCDL